MTPLKAIRAKCLDCCCGQWYEVKMCTVKGCPLYEYRFGHNPALRGKRKNNLTAYNEKKKALNNECEKETK